MTAKEPKTVYCKFSTATFGVELQKTKHAKCVNIRLLRRVWESRCLRVKGIRPWVALKVFCISAQYCTAAFLMFGG